MNNGLCSVFFIFHR